MNRPLSATCTLLLFVLLLWPNAAVAQSSLADMMNNSDDELLVRASQAAHAGDVQMAVRILMKGADAGHVKAQVVLGATYTEIMGDHENALVWIRKAADQGDADAYYLLGLMYLEGRGVPADTTTAFEWYFVAAIRDQTDAQVDLASIYIPRYDFGSSLYWLARAAALGNEDAGTSLTGVIGYLNQQGCDAARQLGDAQLIEQRCFNWVETEYARPFSAATCDDVGMPPGTKGVFLLLKGSMEGYSECGYDLGMMRYMMDRNFEAVRFFIRAAFTGHAGAQYMVGSMYSDGRAGRVDQERAEFWFGTAAQGGDQFAIDKCLELGIDYTSSSFGLSDANLRRFGY